MTRESQNRDSWAVMYGGERRKEMECWEQALSCIWNREWEEVFEYCQTLTLHVLLCMSKLLHSSTTRTKTVGYLHHRRQKLLTICFSKLEDTLAGIQHYRWGEEWDISCDWAEQLPSVARQPTVEQPGRRYRLWKQTAVGHSWGETSKQNWLVLYGFAQCQVRAVCSEWQMQRSHKILHGGSAAGTLSL